MALQRLNLAPSRRHTSLMPIVLSLIIWLLITTITVTCCLILRPTFTSNTAASSIRTQSNHTNKTCNVSLLQRHTKQIKQRIVKVHQRTEQHNQIASVLQSLITTIPANSHLLAFSVTPCLWQIQVGSSALSLGNNISQILNKALSMHFQLIHVHDLKNGQYQLIIDSDDLCKDT